MDKETVVVKHACSFCSLLPKTAEKCSDLLCRANGFQKMR